MWSVHHVFSASLSYSHCCLAQKQVLPTGYSYSQTAPVWVSSTGCSPSGTDNSSVGSPQGYRFFQWGNLSSQRYRCCQDSALAWASRGITASLRHPPALQGGYLLPHGPPCAAGAQLPHHGLHHRLKGSFSSDACSTKSSSFFNDLVACRAVTLTYSHSSLP